MIIQSDQMRMGASRSYQSASASHSRQSAWNAAGSMLYSLEDSSYAFQATYQKSRNSHLAGTRAADNADKDGILEEKNSSTSSDPGGMRNLMEQMNAASGVRRSSIRDAVSSFHRLRQQSLQYLIEMLFGRRYRVDPLSALTGDTGGDLSLSQDSGLYGAGESYYSSFYYSEQETACFDAKGTAVTADGREIPFSINLTMSRSFMETAEHAIDFGLPRLCDPLVINLAAGAADVTDQKFFFDIDADGEQEEISSLGSGSGYLALDKNGDGIINDGSELFGTGSGNGFADLAAYDKDGNGWIDEADEIFSKLKIWTKDANGNDELISLADAGIGAIYLGYENTEFSLNSLEDNHTNAVIRKTGVFLYENGGSGTVQQLDLAT